MSVFVTILDHIRSHPGVQSREMVEALLMRPSTVINVVTLLKRAGLIEECGQTRVHKGGRAISLLRVTDKDVPGAVMPVWNVKKDRTRVARSPKPRAAPKVDDRGMRNEGARIVKAALKSRHPLETIWNERIAA